LSVVRDGQRLTERQAEILVYIKANTRTTAPTLREIGKRFGISSTNGVADHLRALVRKGYIVCEPAPYGSKRAITVARPSDETAWEALTAGERTEVVRWIRAAGNVLTDRARDAAVARLEGGR
jgi:SOS-response transcriptional repressor LexA